jgi:excisionase family DNA binding protein
VTDRLLYRPADAAEQLSVSRTTLYQLVKTGQIEAVRVAADLRIPAVALNAYVARQTAAGKGA